MQFDIAQRKRIRSDTLIDVTATDPPLNNTVIKTKRSRILDDDTSDKSAEGNIIADTIANKNDNIIPINGTANEVTAIERNQSMINKLKHGQSTTTFTAAFSKVYITRQCPHVSGEINLTAISCPLADQRFMSALDVGTGIGTWAIHGDDCNYDWTFKRSSIAFIHIRDLKGCVYWRALLEQAYNTLAPGGILELHEGYKIQWGTLFVDAGKARGMPFEIVEDKTLREEIPAPGFEVIEIYEYRIPLGPWPELEEDKETGRLALEAFVQDILGSMIRLAVDYLGWSEKRCQRFAVELERELTTTAADPYMER
ncbi:hypothetical protein QSH57_004369 [Fusarium oxysporum f. sp. vasinfectum]|nr:hypothetical protein QSH57_004369 [Fusarium oxysporum f. sp. vasinfectum]